MKVDFLRHAESEFNVGIYKRDPDITENGKIQARSIDLKDRVYDIVIVSNLKRTSQTFDNLNIDAPIRFIKTSLIKEYTDGAICNYIENEDMRIETLPELDHRIKLFKEFLNHLKLQDVKHILVISHYGFIQHFLKEYRFIRNCELISFEY